MLSRLSVEAKYRGVTNVVSELCWIQNLLLELHCPITKETLVYCDNASPYLSDNPVQHQRVKDIEIDIHLCEKKLLAVKYMYYMFSLFIKLSISSQNGPPLQL